MRYVPLFIILFLGATSSAQAQVSQTAVLISSGGIHSSVGTVTMSSNLGDIVIGPAVSGSMRVWHGFYVPIPQSLVGVGPSFPPSLVTGLGRLTPNPARVNSTIEFSNALRQSVDLGLYDVSGRRIRQLYIGDLRAGNFRIPWDLRSDAGQSVPAGVYFVRLASRDFRGSRRMVVIR